MLEIVDQLILSVPRQYWDTVALVLALASVLSVLGLLGYLARKLDRNEPFSDDRHV